MSDEGRDRFEIPKEMRSMAEASFEQARKTFEKFVAAAQATAGTIEERNATVRAGAKDISSKAIAYAEKNVQASLDLRAVAAESQGSDRGDAAAQRICAGADARAGGAGQRNGPDRQQGRHGRGQAENLTCRGKPNGSLRRARLERASSRVKYAATHQKLQCVAQI